ncbi:MAG TPA: VOC family protein, partial [Pyrinomonadaceae bacterium]|nr:VOC family protein [Pyrinomonadaceae bacterium]
MITDTATAVNTDTAVKNPLGLKKIHHVEFYVGNAKQAEFFYRKAFGFSRLGYMGLETGNREVTSYLMQQSNINFILTTPMSPEHPGSEHIKQHGDGVHDIAFQVEDADHAFNEAVKRGATPVEAPHDHGDEHGVVRHASIATYGDTIHSFLSYDRVSSPHVSKGAANGDSTSEHTDHVQPPATAGGSDWVLGRAGMEYRDLIPGRLGGKVIVSHIRLTSGGEVPDYVHYHKVDFQMIYCKRGRISVVYEDQGPPFWLETGDCVLQPPEIRHRVLECTAGAEVIEVSMPAEHETWVEHEMELPTSELKPDR